MMREADNAEADCVLDEFWFLNTGRRRAQEQNHTDQPTACARTWSGTMSKITDVPDLWLP